MEKVFYRYNTLTGNAGSVYFEGTMEKIKMMHMNMSIPQRSNFIWPF